MPEELLDFSGKTILQYDLNEKISYLNQLVVVRSFLECLLIRKKPTYDKLEGKTISLFE